jgi:hypothetical protein
LAEKRLQEQNRGQNTSDINHKHDRVAQLVSGIKFPERIHDRLSDDPGIE